MYVRNELPMKLKILLVLTISVLATSARAGTIFDTFGPGNTYDPNSGYGVGFPNASGAPAETAAQFVATANGPLSRVTVGVTFIEPSPGAFNIFLYGDTGGLPDNANQTFLGSATPMSVFMTTNNAIETFAVGGNVPIIAGSTYWIVLKPVDPNELDVWNFSLPITTGNVARSRNDSDWGLLNNVEPAVRVVVPDSGSTILLLTLSFVVVLASRQALKRPEPA